MPGDRSPLGTLDERLVAECVHCGLCLETCPTYVETGNEAESPRGRLYLVHGLIEERWGAHPRVLEHLDLCLGCRACETACPSGVRYGQVLEQTRGLLSGTRTHPRSLPHSTGCCR